VPFRKELDESSYWLELLVRGEIVPVERLAALQDETSLCSDPEKIALKAAIVELYGDDEGEGTVDGSAVGLAGRSTRWNVVPTAARQHSSTAAPWRRNVDSL